MKVTVGKKTISNDGKLLTVFCRNLDPSDKTVETLEWQLKDGQCYFKSTSSDLSIEQEALEELLPWLSKDRLSNEEETSFGLYIALSSRLKKPLSNP